MTARNSGAGLNTGTNYIKMTQGAVVSYVDVQQVAAWSDDGSTLTLLMAVTHDTGGLFGGVQPGQLQFSGQDRLRLLRWCESNVIAEGGEYTTPN